jgi:diguanylate cyclase (GGDEF)-like protein/PAS domain S-box-containing protein
MSTHRTYQHLSLPAVVSLVLGLAGTAIVFVAISYLEYSKMTGDFERRANERLHAVEHGFQDAEAVLADMSRLIAAAGNISRERFQVFVRPLLERHPHIQNFAYHRLISATERPAFEAAMRKLHSNFSITEVVDGKLVPAKLREHYRVVEYVEPMEGNEAAWGLDASTRKAQEEAALHACQTGLPSITEPYMLVQRSLTLRGLVMLAPVYRQGAVLNSATSSCQAVIGYVAAVFDAERLVKQILAKQELLGAEGYGVAVYAGNSRSTDSLVFRTEDPMLSQVSSPATLGILYDQPHERAGTFEAAGRQWQVLVSAAPFPILKYNLASLLTLVGGILSSLLAAAYMQSRVVRSQRTKELNEERAEKQIWEQVLRETNRQLSEEQAHLRELFDQAPGFIAILTGPEHTFDIVNASYYQVVGHRDLIGKPIREALPELEGQGIYELLDRVYATGEPYVGENVPITLHSPSGTSFETRYVDFVYQPMTDAAGEVTGIFVQGSDISRQTKAQLELEYLSNHDVLTGLPNYSIVQARLKEIMAQAEKEGQSTMVMVIDIDRFRSVNESLGQVAADRFLKIIAARLQSIAQKDGAAARLSGDKFLLALPLPMQGKNGDYSCAIQSIREVIGKEIDIDGHIFFLTCSIGIATSPGDAVVPEALIQCADLAMYRAKELGPNNFQLYTPKQNERIRERLKIETAMRNALERSEFMLYYQPQVDLRTGDIVGVEALIRWQHPEFGMLSPDSFIAIAEDTGLIVPIGAWALRTACKQVKVWHNAGFEHLRIAVNLSARQFGWDDLSVLVRESLEENRLPADRLDLELTESLVMTDVEHAVGILKSLSELGVQLSIDDFGTGYSSLAYLKRFPINVLKIDRSFIRELPENSNDAAIADAIISMAHSLGIRVIAEGVETEAQCEFLSRNMCDEIQGYLFSKALPALEMEALLNESRRLPEHLLRLQEPARTLLLVDDEPSILSALKRQLRQDGYQILTAADGHKGLELLAQNKVDVIVSDQRMPGMTGVEFLRKVKTLYPDTVRIVLSGFTELQSVTDAVNEGAIYKFLTKPWDDNQLREHVAEAFQNKGMADENRRLSIEVRTANQELASANRQLEELLKYKQQQIQRREISLDIVREALQYVPLPVIGLDEDQIVVFANIAANELFEKGVSILGNPVDQFIPELSHAISGDKSEQECMTIVNGVPFEIVARRMGQGTQSRGSLITFTRQVQ